MPLNKSVSQLGMFKTNSYFVGGRHDSATNDIHGAIDSNKLKS